MRKIIAVALASVFALPVLSTITVAVYAEDSGTTTNTTTTTAPVTTSTEQTSQGGDDAKSIADRVEKRKTELKIKLSTIEKTRIKAKCKASQGLLSSEKGRIKGIETSRSEVYKNLLNRLNDLSDRLKAKGVDTTDLNNDITALKTKIDTFNTDLTAYKQAVSDLAGMDCATDPDGFKASLETARTALKKVNDDATAIRTYLTGTIKPLLQTIRSQLAKTEGTSDQSSTSNSQTTTPPTTGSTGTTNNTSTSGGN
jgi:chromosome segregation ATPase